MELFLEEKRTLIDLLNQSKKKSIKEIVKKLHEIDRPGGTLEKAVGYFFNKLYLDYKDRFNLWRMTHF